MARHSRDGIGCSLLEAKAVGRRAPQVALTELADEIVHLATFPLARIGCNCTFHLTAMVISRNAAFVGWFLGVDRKRVWKLQSKGSTACRRQQKDVSSVGTHDFTGEMKP